ncbi:MAG: pectate lyase [Verrucomicrobiales bacterium]|nr:pectate lyase [Verrucomicrobiales bacterium]
MKGFASGSVWACAVGIAWAVCGGEALTVAVASGEPYLGALRKYADQVLEHGRDHYGNPTPLFVDGLDVETRKPVTWKWANGREWVLCNLANQQGLFRLLDGLTELSGEPRYRDAAMEALRYAFAHLRFGTRDNGGLLAWGGHLAYDATSDVPSGNPGGTGRIHELKTVFPHYDLMWRADPVATRQVIENLWTAHVLDWGTLDFNRHGNPTPRGRLWSHEYRGGDVFFWGKGLTFHNAGSDFYFAAGMLARFDAAPEPLVWARRLSERYAETRDPKTGLEGFQFSQCATAWCDDAGKILGDRAQYQYAEDFPGHRVVEGTLFPCYDDLPAVGPQAGRLLLAEALGDRGDAFLRHAVDQLTAWGKIAYRREDNAFVPMLTDGTPMEGYVCRKDGYFGPKGRVLKAGHPGAEHLWLYAFAARLSRDPFLWEMARNIARGNGWGDIGASPGATPSLQVPESTSHPHLLMAMLELHRRTGAPAFLASAESLGLRILSDRVVQGWFVPSRRHVYTRLANDESEALLHLVATLRGRAGAVPAFTGAEPFFHAEYGSSSGRVYDTQQIYARTR